ncbi:MAG: hypothetical protein K5923_03225 [Clostridia bacterium]|nr:hypothetical protein [Clostridia bacterium]
MKNFCYVNKAEFGPVYKDLEKLIHLVQDEVRDKFTFSYAPIGSYSRNMITRDANSNVGYDFDINIRVNDDDENYSAQEIKDILIKGFNKYNHLFSYDYCEDSKRVITIKVKDKKHSKILHSVDFAVVYDCDDGRQQYIRFNKAHNSYAWEYQPKGFYRLEEKIEAIKGNHKWQEVRDRYIEKKNNNNDINKKSRSLFAETINDVYNMYFEEIEDDDWEDDDDE